MQNKRWWRPLLAFLITFGVLALLASVVRVIVVYQHFYALGMQPDDPTVAVQASREVAKMDRVYTPLFLLVATVVSALAAGVFARWRPQPKIDLPPSLPDEGDAETR